jgi:hypothetical protein
VASRAEAAVVSRWPTVGSVVRAALGDFYVNSLRLVAANLLWGATLIGVWLAFLITPLGVLFLPLLAFPTASIFRIAVLVVRGGPLSLREGLRVWQTDPIPILGLGVVLVSCLAVFLVNIVSGVLGGGVIGWVVATCAAWGAGVAWLVSWTAWPLLLDPSRADRSVRERLRTAVLLVLAYPIRLGMLGAVLAVFVLASTVALIALMTISVAFAALMATRYVLPAADRLEERMRPERSDGSGGGAPAMALRQDRSTKR